MSDCGYDGVAEVRAHYNHMDPHMDPVGTPEWVHADERIHVARELVDKPEARTFFETKYVIGDWCPEVHAFHADLKETDK